MAKFALCIGINDYPGTGSDLAGCVNDVRDWSALLQKKGFAVLQIIDKQATGKNIRSAIESPIGGAKSGDTVIIQYSGHGSYVPDENGDEPDGTDECICPYDINSKGPITDDELFELYSSKKTGVKLLVISDSCHSGTVAKFAPITTPPTIKAGARRLAKCASYRRQLSYQNATSANSASAAAYAVPLLQDVTRRS